MKHATNSNPGSLLEEFRVAMAKMPPIPPANRPHKGPEDKHHKPEGAPDLADHKHHNAGEQGETANIKQNTTNKGFFKGRRVK